MEISKSIHNKENLIRLGIKFLTSRENVYVFPVGTSLKLWYFGKKEEHRLLSLELGSDKKSIVLSSIVNNEREIDNLKEFDFSEIKSILKLVE